jgi:23S rRNA (cytosine1962-C5)-methyltransferase
MSNIVTINQRGAARLKAGHLWVYRSDVATTEAKPGALVEVHDERGRRLGSALYSSSSQIAIRQLTSEPLTETTLPHLIRDRIAAAVSFRQANTRDTDSYRVIFSEADLLPGLIVDRYNDLLAMQILTQAFDRDELRQAVVDSLVKHFPDATLIERVDPHIRELEQLPPRESQLLRAPDSTRRVPHPTPSFGMGWEQAGEGARAGMAYSGPPSESDSKGVTRSSPDSGPRLARTIFTFNGVRFHFDALGGQKTGAFLDQRENYAAAARYAHGQALDCFTYQGGFALHLARVCDHVAAVDSSRPALEVAEQNEQLNRENHRSGEIEWTEANAFDLLKDYATSGRQYDTIVLDPPAFAKSKRAVETALRGYKELNLRALKMVRPGGVLVTCSCSFHVSEPEFLEMLGSAAADAGRRVRILEKRGAAIDHSVLLNVPETGYLKCLICQVEV